MIALISDPRRITPEWLTEVLQAHGSLAPGGCVVDTQWQTIGTGKMGDNARFTLTYDGVYDAPKTLVAKLPAADETARSIAGAMGAYRKEVMFYRELAPRSALAIPGIYLELLDDSGTDFIILMEDLAPAEPGNQLVGESVARTKLALAEVAKLHAAFHGDSAVLSKDYITHTDADSAAFGQELMQQNWPGFVERFGSGLSQACIEFGNDYVANHARWVTHYTGSKTLAHGDFRTENLLFREGGRTTTVDWQTMTETCGLADVAYFLGGSMTTEDRRQSEKELVEYYRQQLSDSGVQLSPEDCWQLYRAFAPHGMMLTVLGAMFTEPEERSDKMFLVMAQRHLQHCVDVNAREFL